MINKILGHKLVKKQRNLILYGLIGITGATLDFILYIVFYKYAGIPPFIASFLSVSAGIINNFIWNVRHNFKVSGKMLSRFASFYFTGLSGAILSSILILMLFNGLGIDPTIAKLLTIVPVVILQFYINKHVSFADDPDRFFRVMLGFVRRHWLSMLIIAVSAAFIFSSVFFMIAADDMDNMLGGKLILEGQLPYTGFFSQHAPGMYFLSAVMYLFSHNDIFMYRLIFNGIFFALLLVTYFVLRRRTSPAIANYYILLASVGHIVALAHLPLGESLVSVLLPLSVVLVFLRPTEFLSTRQLMAVSIILFLIPFLSLSCIFPAAIVYLLVAILVLRKSFRESSILQALLGFFILLLPYLCFILYLYLSSSFHVITYDLFTFNALYYAPAAGQPSGGVLIVVFNIFLHALSEISTVAQSLFTPSYFPQAIMLTAFGVFSAYLWSVGKRFEAVLVPLMLLLLDTGTNIFNPPAIESPLYRLAQHASPYVGMAFLAASVGAVGFISVQYRAKRASSFMPALSFIVLILLPIACLGVWSGILNKIFVTGTERNYYTYSKQIKTNNLAVPINKLTTSNETAWISGGNFADQLYMEPQRATEFTFWQSMIAPSPDLNSQLLRELKADQPEIIYYTPVSRKGKYLDPGITRYIESHYFKSHDKRLENYYFKESNRALLTERLVKNGYEL
jgi:putative flippase GtrA